MISSLSKYTLSSFPKLAPLRLFYSFDTGGDFVENLYFKALREMNPLNMLPKMSVVSESAENKIEKSIVVRDFKLGETGARAAKLQKFINAGGLKIGGCPTLAKTDFSDCLGIYRKIFSGSGALVPSGSCDLAPVGGCESGRVVYFDEKAVEETAKASFDNRESAALGYNAWLCALVVGMFHKYNSSEENK